MRNDCCCLLSWLCDRVDRVRLRLLAGGLGNKGIELKLVHCTVRTASFTLTLHHPPSHHAPLHSVCVCVNTNSDLLTAVGIGQPVPIGQPLQHDVQQLLLFQ
jgi:hypothetical protein